MKPAWIIRISGGRAGVHYWRDGPFAEGQIETFDTKAKADMVAHAVRFNYDEPGIEVEVVPALLDWGKVCMK